MELEHVMRIEIYQKEKDKYWMFPLFIVHKKYQAKEQILYSENEPLSSDDRTEVTRQ